MRERCDGAGVGPRFKTNRVKLSNKGKIQGKSLADIRRGYPDIRKQFFKVMAAIKTEAQAIALGQAGLDALPDHMVRITHPDGAPLSRVELQVFIVSRPELMIRLCSKSSPPTSSPPATPTSKARTPVVAAVAGERARLP